ncbi:ABC transporter ATP-binding protein [Fluviispira multicolorata]|uniref:ATP-binding cassette domain-containing protein n=1 Tax=Fluviispira multicolorata TaxID=2654512 RepID=A0A833N499_9BACT|nr:ATP-binding cassette domain-containing protein [Fluviispira multicolorata]KAB8030621.1 ATP-binding cassette domain-containing protein [Fluviispira multicolorata]
MSCYLLCENIELKAGYNTLISSFSLKLYSKESIALIGPNGSGKTSLLRVLAGISRPYKGKIFVMEEELWPINNIRNEHYSVFLTNIPSLLMDHCVLWNLEFYTESYGLKFSKEEYSSALSKVNLEGRESQSARTLSTGQKRRLSLAALYLIKPNIILADEPTNGLDESGCNLCIQIFNELSQKNMSSILIATHDQKLIQWCQKTISLEEFIPKPSIEKKLVKKLL